MPGLKIVWSLRAGKLIAKWTADEQPLSSAIVRTVSSTDGGATPARQTVLRTNLPNTQEGVNNNEDLR